MSPLVTQAMAILTDTCNLSFLHPLDEDSVKLHLKALHQHGETLDSTELKLFAEAHGWQKEPVKQLSKWAETISTGGRVVIKHKSHAKTEKQIIAHLKSRITETTTA
jgi:hypothetical protein